MSREIPMYWWKSNRLMDGTGQIDTKWERGLKEDLFEIGAYNDFFLTKELTLNRAVFRGTNQSKLDIIIKHGIDRIDTLATSKMFWASPFGYKCVEFGGDRKAIMVYDNHKIALTAENERMQPGIEKEFQIRGHQHIYKFLDDPLEALLKVILNVRSKNSGGFSHQMNCDPLASAISRF